MGGAGSGSYITRQEKAVLPQSLHSPAPSANQAFGIRRPLAVGLGELWGPGGGPGRLLTEGKVFGKRRRLWFGNCRAL